MSTFSGISTALSSLYANRQAMEVTAHNIANANTEGYTRQRAEMKALGGLSVPGLSAQAKPVGSGVVVDSVQRLRDTFLESRARTEHARSELLAGQQQMLNRIEQAFAEPSDTALQSQLTELWSSFGDLANQPGEASARTAVLARATIVADSVRGTAAQLSSLWDTAREQLDGVVTEVNDAAKAVAELNRAVMAANSSGQPANDLADQRDVLVMKLSELTGARATARPDGSIDVQISGASLVAGTTYRTLGTPTGADSLAAVQSGGRVDVQWTDATGSAVTPASGKLAAAMESLNQTLRDYADGLDSVARNLATTVNTQHALGRDRNGDLGDAFFTGGPTGISASSIRVSQDLLDDPDLLAAAADTPIAGPLDGGNADALAKLAKKPGGPDREYRQLVVDLGVAAQTVNRRLEIQADVVGQVDAARTGESGVNLDEEMSNLIAFERAYQAAAKVISTIDEMLNTVINGMGR